MAGESLILEQYDGTRWRAIGLPTFTDAAARDTHYPAPYSGLRAYTLDDHCEFLYREDEWILQSQKITISASAPTDPKDGDVWLQPV